MTPVLVVAGEPSGDAAAARVANQLSAPTFGMGASALSQAGTDLLWRTDRTAALGLQEVFGKVPSLLLARRRMLTEASRRRSREALLVNYSEFNTSLLSPLSKLGVRSVFYGPPQVWAWRPERAKHIAKHVGLVAAILPFEVDVWQRAGAKVTYVGHPALDQLESASGEPERLKAPSGLVALVPGSRPAEVRAHLPIMLSALKLVGVAPGLAHVFVAPGLPGSERNWMHTTCDAAGVPATTLSSSDSLVPLVRGYPIALVASGTASLEAALAGSYPIIGYRMSPLSAAVAKRVLRLPHVGLPNILLGRGAFPELLQEAWTSQNVARALENALREPRTKDGALAELRMAIAVKNRPCDTVAALLSSA